MGEAWAVGVLGEQLSGLLPVIVCPVVCAPGTQWPSGCVIRLASLAVSGC